MTAIADVIKEAIADALERVEARDEAARGIAREALQAIQSHERVCALRAEEAQQYRESIRAQIQRLNNIMWGALVTLNTGLIGVLGAILWPRLFP